MIAECRLEIVDLDGSDRSHTSIGPNEQRLPMIRDRSEGVETEESIVVANSFEALKNKFKSGEYGCH